MKFMERTLINQLHSKDGEKALINGRILNVRSLGNITFLVVQDYTGTIQVVFEKDIDVKGKIYVTSDQAGTVSIRSGATSTEIVFATEYDTVPKITVTPQIKLSGKEYWVSDKTTRGFRINSDVAEVDIPFDWIAFGARGDGGQPPVIDDLITSLDTVGIGIPVELWAKVTDPDTKESDLTYRWRLDPGMGTISGTTGLVYWSVDQALTEHTDVTVTVTVSDGSHSVSQSKVIRVLASASDDSDETVQNPPNPSSVEGCMDSTAMNFNADATQDDGSCQYQVVEQNNEDQITTVPGCMDSTAVNYNQNATEDDGSCEAMVTTEVPIILEPEVTISDSQP